MGGLEKPNHVYDYAHNNDADNIEHDHTDPSLWDYYTTTVRVFQSKEIKDLRWQVLEG